MSFEALAKMAQTSRNPCGKQAFSMSGARDAARDRNRFRTDKTFYPVVCFEGCGREVFHLTSTPPRGKARDMFTKKSNLRNRKKRAAKLRSKARARAAICTWEGEGGSYGD